MSITTLATVYQNGTPSTGGRPVNFFLCTATTDIAAISSPIDGDLAYDQQAHVLYNYVNAAWVVLTTGASSLYQLLSGKNAASGYAGLNSGSKLDLVRGGTNADLSATGGTSKVLKQASAGAAITVGQLDASDITNFSATSLSDYAAGTWTPKFGGSSVDGTHTYNIQFGSYVKIGKLVIISFWINVTVKDGTVAGTYLQLINLPFTASNLQASMMWGGVNCYSGNIGSHGFLMLQLQQNMNRVYLVYNDGQSYVAATEMTSSSFIAGSLAYFI